MHIKKLWIAVLLGMLLVLSLVGEAGARDRAAVSAWKYVTVPAAAFHPMDSGSAWWNYGSNIQAVGPSQVAFVAPVIFPGLGAVTVKKVILYAHDSNSSYNARVRMWKTNPATGSEALMADAKSYGALPGIRAFSDTTITHATIHRQRGAYLLLNLQGTLVAYSVKVAYTD